jgi:hypothetical protein
MTEEWRGKPFHWQLSADLRFKSCLALPKRMRPSRLTARVACLWQLISFDLPARILKNEGMAYQATICLVLCWSFSSFLGGKLLALCLCKISELVFRH